MIKDWNIKIDGRELDEIEIIDALLESRGIKDVKRFLNPSEDDMLPLDALENIDLAAQIVMNAIENNEKIIIHFDTDVDGNTSGTIMYRYLLSITSNLQSLINNGKEHGVQNFPLDVLNDQTTLIVVDSLNNDTNVYQNILNTGAKLVVLDHHLVEEDLQEFCKHNTGNNFCLVSSAVNYPNPALSGAGVVFKFCKYLDELNWTDYADEFWDLAATGIIQPTEP